MRVLREGGTVPPQVYYPVWVLPPIPLISGLNQPNGPYTFDF